MGALINTFAHLLSAQKQDTVKGSQVSVREKTNIKLSFSSILFIQFNIKTMFLYLQARVCKSLEGFGIVEIFIFILILV